MKKIILFIKMVNFKSLFFNFKYLPFKKAIYLPILISKNCLLTKTKGVIIIDAPIKTGMIKIGYAGVGIFDHNRSRSIWQVSGKVIFRGRAEIGHGSKISVNKGGCVEFGANFSISAESKIISNKHIKFGNDVLISWDCLIMDTDFHKILDKKNNIINPDKPIIIGDRVWITCQNLILKGSIIGNDSIIGAKSKLSSDISNKSGLFSGAPIKFISEDAKFKK